MRVFDFYQLEDRVLLNADGPEGSDAVEVEVDAQLADSLLYDLEEAASANASSPTEPAQSEPAQSEPAEDEAAVASDDTTLRQPARRFEIIFIDAAVDDAETLIDGLRSESGDAPVDWLVVHLAPQGDGLGQITAALADARDVDAIHILSHGDGGSLQLAGQRITADSLLADAGTIARWADSLDADADLLIYGCDLASTAEGRSLLESFAALSGADVAASDDATGSADLGGDWVLEYAAGGIESDVAFTYQTRSSWTGVLAIINVTNTNDTGAGSLRQAISDANLSTGVLDTISFDIATSDGGYVDPTPGSPGSGDEYWRIALTSFVGFITDSVIIDATSQSGYAGTPVIELDGSGAAGATAGFVLRASNSTIRGFSIHSFADEGLEIDGAHSDNILEDNWIGITAAGVVAGNADNGVLLVSGANNNIVRNNVISGNLTDGIEIRGVGSDNNWVYGNTIGLKPDGATAANGGHGIQILGGASGNLIGTNDDGTSDADEKNIISGNALDGIYVDNAAGTVIKGNLVGTDATGTIAVGNGDEGISIQNSSSNTTIGGSSAAARNIISGNAGAGVLVEGNSSGTTIQGNYVGADITGTLDLGNAKLNPVGDRSGIRFSNAGAASLVGGTSAGEGNLIAFNFMHGVEVLGTSTGVQIRGNSIRSNTGIGINLSGGTEDANLVTANDASDADTGANNLQNLPILTKAVVGSTGIYLAGQINTSASSTYQVDFYASATADASGYGEAERFLGSTTVTTDASGYAHFYATLASTVSAGESISATATGPDGSTSEFAANLTAYNRSSTLWLTTAADVASPSGATGLDAWSSGDALEFGNPNLSLEPGSTSGTFSSRFHLGSFASDGDANIDAIHYVTRNLTVGAGANTFDLLAGDVLLSTAVDETLTSLNSLSISHMDAFVFRPGSAGDYSSGRFYELLDNNGFGLQGLTLVEQDTLVGDVVLQAGEFLFSRDGGSPQQDIMRYTSTGVGSGTTTGSTSILIAKADIGIDGAIHGIGLIESTTEIGGHTLPAGAILLALAADDASVGSNGLAVTAQDVFYLDVTQTTLGSGAAIASATLLMDGSDVGLDTAGEALDGITLFPSFPPTVSLPGGAISYSEDNPAAIIDATAIVSDVDSANFDAGTLTIDLTVGGSADDRLSVRNQGTGIGEIGISGSDVTYNFGSGAVIIGTFAGGTDGSTPLVITLNANSDVASTQALLRNITYQNVSEDPSTTARTVRFVLSDGDGGTSVPRTTSINVSKVNDAPVLDNSGALSFTSIAEDETGNTGDTIDAILASAGGDRLTDVDSGAVEGVAVTGLTSGSGTWEYTIDGGSNWAAVGAVSDASALLLRGSDRLRFIPASANADAASITFRGWDQTSGSAGSKVDTSTNGGTTAFSTATDTADITVTAVNDAPVNSVPGAQTTTTNSSLVFSSGNGNQISIGDVDAGANPLQVTLAATSGTITLATTAGLTFSNGDGTGDASMTFTGTTTAINAALNGSIFAPTSDFNGAAGLQIVTDDRGNTGSGGALSDTDSIAITVNPVNKLWLTTSGDVAAPSGAPGLNSWTSGTALELGGSTLALEPGTTNGSFSSLFNLDSFASDGNASIDAIHYVGRDLTVGAVNSIQLFEGDVLLSLTTTEILTSTNSATFDSQDVLIFRPDSGGDYSSGSFGLLIDGSDILSNELQGISLVEQDVVVGDVTLRGGDLLLAQSGNIQGDRVYRYRPDSVGTTSTGVLSVLIDGGAIGLAREIVGIDVIENEVVIGGRTLTAGQVLVSLSVDDSSVGSNGISTTQHDIFVLNMTSTGVNTTATATLLFEGADVGLNSASENVHGLTLFTPQQVPNADPVASDDSYNVDEGGTLAIAASGILTNDSDSDGDPITVNLLSGPANASTFQLNSDGSFSYTHNGSETTSDSFTYTASDGRGGTASGTVNLTINPVNDAPVLDGTASLSLSTITENQTSSLGNTVASVLASGGDPITDADSGSVEGIAINGLDSSNGSWQYSLNGGVNWSTIGAVSDAAALLLRSTDRIRFLPDGQNADAASITFRAWDQTSGVAGAAADTTTNGGTTAFSTATATAAITVTSVNDAPTTASIEAPDLSYTENQAAVSITSTITVGDVDVEDPNLESATIQITGNYSSGEDVLAFSDTGNITGTWNAATGTLTLSGTDTLANYQTALRSVTYANTSDDPSTALRTVTFTVNDGQLDSNTQSRDIAVTAVNDLPVITSDGGAATANLNQSENTAVVTTVTSTDLDGGAPVYSITGGADAAEFTIDANTGELGFASAPNHESPTDADGDNVYEVTVQVSDGAGGTDTQSLSIEVTDLDEFDITPVDDSDAAANAADENAGIGTTIGITAFADDSDGTDSVSYSLDDDAGGRFAIDANTGAVTVAGSLDYESATSHNITVRATSTDGSTETRGFTIAINDLDESDVTPIVDNDAAADAVDENAAVGTTVGVTAFADDSDGTDSVGYSLEDDAGGLFAIDANTGAVTIAGSLDYESATSHNITVRATSTDGSTQTRDFTVAVNDLDEFDITPIDDSDAAADAVDENASVGTTVGVTAFADDSDGTDSVGYSLEDDAGGLFAIDANTGAVTVAGSLDYESATSHNITVRATSSDGSSRTRDFAIGINDLNDNAPIIPAGQTLSMDEAAANGQVIGNALATDADSVGTLQNWTIISGDPDGVFAIEASTGQITIADNATLDYETISQYDLIVRVSDGNQPSAAQTVSIKIQNVNEAPVLVDNQLTISEGGQVVLSGSDLSATDVDTAPASLQFNVTSADGGHFERVSAPGVSISSFLQSEVSTGQIRFVHDGGEDPPMYEITVSDGSLLDGPSVAAIDFTNVNDASDVIPASGSIVYMENDPARQVLPGVSIIDPDSNFIHSVTVTLAGYLPGEDSVDFAETAAITGVWDATTATLTFAGIATTAEYEAALQTVAYSNSSETPTTDARQFTVVAFDGTDLSAVSTITLNVVSVNDAPLAVADSYSVRANQSLTVEVPGVLVNDFDVDGDLLFPVIVTGPASGQVSLDAQGRLVYTPTPGFFGTDVIRYQASDGMASSAVVEIRIEVTAINGATSPPAIPLPAPQTPPTDAAANQPSPSMSTNNPTTAEEAVPANEGATSGGASSPSAVGMLPADPNAPAWMQVALPMEDSQDADGSQRQSGNASDDGGEPPTRGSTGDRLLRSSSGHSGMQVETLQQLLRADIQQAIVWGRWDEIRDEMAQRSSYSNFAVGAVDATAAIASVGYAMWAIRGSVFVTSMFGSLPAWRLVDPASMLLAYRNRRATDDDSVERMLA